MPGALKRELRVALSTRVQPVWLRITKWIVFLGITAALFHTSFFWYWLIGLPLLGLCIHLFYRWKTRAWTRPWGGWNDLESGK